MIVNIFERYSLSESGDSMLDRRHPEGFRDGDRNEGTTYGGDAISAISLEPLLKVTLG